MSEELEARIREILNNGTVRYNPHLKTRMAERNYEMGDVLYILRNDKVLKFKKQGNDKYHCEIHGEDLEGYRGAVCDCH